MIAAIGLLASTALNLNFPAIPAEYKPKIPAYQKDWPGKSNARSYIFDPYGKGDYASSTYTRYIDQNEIDVIVEIGSRDALDALELSDFYHRHVFAFECNPRALQICRHNIGENPNVTLVPLAVWDETATRSFYPVIPGEKVFNLGASSLFRFDSTCPDAHPQKEIQVQTIRLDEWMQRENISHIDLLCIDAQGATLQILRGLGKSLFAVKYIIAECEYTRYYAGEALYEEINTFLNSRGFTQVATIDCLNYYGNPLYIRNDLKDHDKTHTPRP